ncbi:MAG: type II toxin-antitoxin system prevent-host-death family antitoxin [Pseudomonadales bacterium]
MKIMQATDAKNRFGELLKDSSSQPVLIQKNGRDVAVVLSKAEYDRRFQIVAKKDLIREYHEESIQRYGHLYEELAK